MKLNGYAWVKLTATLLLALSSYVMWGGWGFLWFLGAFMLHEVDHR